MKRFWVVIAVLFSCVAGLAFASRAESTSVKGDYVEVRTASVFAGACHFNGEIVTAGREALMAWSISSGSWNGVDLAGVKAIAVVSSDANLAEKGAHRSELIIDSAASHTQAVAMAKALEANYAATLGQVMAVTSAPINFAHKDKTYEVSSPEANIDVESMPNDLCCRQPNLVWYDPLAPLQQRKVGYTIDARYRGHIVSESWQRAGENSAFYGSFAF